MATLSLLPVVREVLLIQDVVRPAFGGWLRTGPRLCACILRQLTWNPDAVRMLPYERMEEERGGCSPMPRTVRDNGQELEEAQGAPSWSHDTFLPRPLTPTLWL